MLVPIFEYPSDTPIAERTASISEMYDHFRIENKGHPVIVTLDALGPPVYLPLDRRWESDDRGIIDQRQRTSSFRYRTSPRQMGVIESVLYLAERSSREQQTELAQLNEKLREDLVEYTFGDVILFENLGNIHEIWTVSEIEKRKETILGGLLKADIHLSEGVVEKYFNSLIKIAKALKGSDKKRKDSASTEWFINFPQFTKIERVIKRMEQYNKDRTNLFRKTDGFVETVNSFLCDTGKRIRFDTSNEIVVQFEDKHEIRPENLSSGERQLVILFTYLYFGFPSKKQFVVMIDEPELSIHLQWQNRYVESVKKANPDAQFIFATHAPEIAHEYQDRCIDLDAEKIKHDEI